MPSFEEETVAALHSLWTKIETLKQISIRDLLKADVYHWYEQTIQEAYDALPKVEDALTALGMKLEYQHYRLSCAVDELTPLVIQSRSKVDAVMEEFLKRFP